MVEEVDRPDGPPIPAAELPAWLAQFEPFLDVRRLERGELLAECLFCNLALIAPVGFAPAEHPQTILDLAQHGVQHAVDGKVRR